MSAWRRAPLSRLLASRAAVPLSIGRTRAAQRLPASAADGTPRRVPEDKIYMREERRTLLIDSLERSTCAEKRDRTACMVCSVCASAVVLSDHTCKLRESLMTQLLSVAFPFRPRVDQAHLPKHEESVPIHGEISAHSFARAHTPT